MISNKTQPNDLLTGAVFNTLKSMTIPMIYGLLFLMTFNVIDTFFISLLGTEPLAAISFTFPITFTIISLFIGLGIGTSAVISKLYGKGDIETAKCMGTSALFISSIIVGFISFIGYLLIDPIFLLLGAHQTLLPLIHDYMNIWFLGSIALMGPMIGNAILRAWGDTKTPSLIMGAAGLINAVLDPILIFGFGPIPALGVQGAALATLISWLIGTAIVLYILTIKKPFIHATIPSFSLLIQTSKAILKIGLPAAGANILTPISSAILTAIVAPYGVAAVAAFGVGFRIESIACLLVLAISMTLPVFIGQNFGAGHISRVKQAYLQSIKFTLIWQFFVYIVLVLLAPWIARIFTDDPEVIDLIVLFIRIIPLAYGLQGIIILTNSSYNALHKPITALVLSIIRLFICYVPLAYLGSVLFGLTGFFIGAVCGNIVMSIISYRLFSQQFKHQNHVKEAS